MAPFYERDFMGNEQVVSLGSIVAVRHHGPGVRSTVEISDNNHAIVEPAGGRGVYVGDFDPSKGQLKDPVRVTGRTVLCRRSVSPNARGTHGVVWRKR